MYKTVLPRASKSNYPANELIDFTLYSQDMMYVANSLRLSGRVSYNSAGARLAIGPETTYAYDGICGVHTTIEQLSVETTNAGMIETINDYNRTYKAIHMGTTSRKNCLGGLRDGLALAPAARMTLPIMRGGSASSFSVPFSIIPMCCLTAMEGNLSFNNTGQIIVSLRLASVLSVLYGSGVDADTEFALSDLQMDYMVTPDLSSGLNGKDSSLKPTCEMRVLGSVKQIFDSSTLSFSMNFPQKACNSVIATFVPITAMQSGISNQFACVQPSLYNLEFSLSDSSLGLISYRLDSLEDMYRNYLLAAQSPLNTISTPATGHCFSTLTNFPLMVDSTDCFGIGINFGTQYVDLTQTRFGLTVSSDVINGNPHYCYVVIIGLQTM